MNPTRRNLLKGAGGAIAALFVAGLVKPIRVLAGTWNEAAFQSKDLKEALSASGAAGAADSTDVVLTAPGIAEDGAVVPIVVRSNIPDTTRVSVFVEQNPYPLAASFDFMNEALPEVGVRLKFGKTSTVRAVVMAGGKAYTAHKDVKVTAGGCGG